MAVLTKDELLTSLKGILQDNTSDDALKILEDASDTITDLEEKTKDSTKWKEKFEQNDKEWRTKYTERFFSEQPTPETTPEPTPEPSIPMTFEDLFKAVTTLQDRY